MVHFQKKIMGQFFIRKRGRGRFVKRPHFSREIFCATFPELRFFQPLYYYCLCHVNCKAINCIITIIKNRHGPTFKWEGSDFIVRVFSSSFIWTSDHCWWQRELKIPFYENPKYCSKFQPQSILMSFMIWHQGMKKYFQDKK